MKIETLFFDTKTKTWSAWCQSLTNRQAHEMSVSETQALSIIESFGFTECHTEGRIIHWTN